MSPSKLNWEIEFSVIITSLLAFYGNNITRYR